MLRVVLSHSWAGYSEVVERQTTDVFIRCIENAFYHFGGAPQTLVLDNLRAAVSKADWFDPELNPKVQSFLAHYGVVALPTKPYTPRHKGKIERGIDYVQSNGLKGRTFTSIAEQNAHLRGWEAHVIASTMTVFLSLTFTIRRAQEASASRNSSRVVTRAYRFPGGWEKAAFCAGKRTKPAGSSATFAFPSTTAEEAESATLP